MGNVCISTMYFAYRDSLPVILNSGGSRILEWGLKGRGWGLRRDSASSPLPKKLEKNWCNDAFLCTIFTCFKMHSVNKGGGGCPLQSPLSLNLPLILNIYTIICFFVIM